MRVFPMLTQPRAIRCLRPGRGVAKLLTLGGLGFWAFDEATMLAAGEVLYVE